MVFESILDIAQAHFVFLLIAFIIGIVTGWLASGAAQPE